MLRLMASPLTDAQVIEKLGGPPAFEAFGYSKDAVRKWMDEDRGIPWKDRLLVKDLAEKQGLKLPPDFDRKRRAA